MKTNKSILFDAIAQTTFPEKVKKSPRRQVKDANGKGLLSDQFVSTGLANLQAVGENTWALTLIPKYTKQIRGKMLGVELHKYAPELNKIVFKDGTKINVTGAEDEDTALFIAALAEARKEIKLAK